MHPNNKITPALHVGDVLDCIGYQNKVQPFMANAQNTIILFLSLFSFLKPHNQDNLVKRGKKWTGTAILHL